jgi:hypothetical protein
MQPHNRTLECRVEPTPMLLGLCYPSVNSVIHIATSTNQTLQVPIKPDTSLLVCARKLGLVGSSFRTEFGQEFSNALCEKWVLRHTQ